MGNNRSAKQGAPSDWEFNVRTPADTAIETLHIVKDNHCSLGYLEPSILLKWMDIAACLAAERHARKSCVTLSMDDLVFSSRVVVGDALRLQAQVNCAFRTSMEVGLLVLGENVSTGEVRKCASAYFVFVCVANQS
eukprot:g4291.t1